MLVLPVHTFVLCTLLSHLAQALPAPRPATTAPTLPRDTDAAESRTAIPSTSTSLPVGRYVKRSQHSSTAHQWSGPKGINLLGDDESPRSSESASASKSGRVHPTPASASDPSSSPSGFKIKTMFGTINCSLGGGWKNLWGGGDKSGGDKGNDHGGGNDSEEEEEHQSNNNEEEEEHENNEEEHEENNHTTNKWDNFVSQFKNIWESDAFNTQTWQSDSHHTESWESESWTSAWSSFNSWNSEWASSNGWSSAWSSFEGWTSDSWTSDGWTSGASDFTESMTFSDESQASWVSQGSSGTWGSSGGWSSGANSQTFSVESGYTMITKTNSAGEAVLTKVPVA